MDIVALSVGVFGVSSLAAAFTKCTIAKMKTTKVKDHTRNSSRHL